MSPPAPNPTHSSSRVAPECRHFGTCGACSWLDRSIDDQLATKLATVREHLAPHLASDAVEPAEAPRRAPRYVRTKLLYPARPHPKTGKLQLGLYERGSHQLIEIDQCQLQDPCLTEFGNRAQKVLRNHRLAPYDEQQQSGFIRGLFARLMPNTNQLLLGLLTRGGTFDSAPEVAADLVEAATGLRQANGRKVQVVGLVRNIHDAPGNVLLGPRSLPLTGRDYQEDDVGGLRFRVSLSSFYQVHRGSDAILYRPAMSMIGDVRRAKIVDAYAGVGTFGLRLAKAGAAKVELIEDSPIACRDAAENIRRNKLGAVARVQQAPFATAQIRPKPDWLIVDPPRRGLDDGGIEAVRRASPRQILYVSCGLKSLTRDLTALAPEYAVRAARLADLFPHSDHVEVFAALVRRSE